RMRGSQSSSRCRTAIASVALSSRNSNRGTLDTARKSDIIRAMPPVNNLNELWEEHTKHEFETKNVESTLATMTDDAYVNHVPVLTGGYGKPALRAFYSRDFIPSM